MTAFRPGDLAVVTGDTKGWQHAFEAGTAVQIVSVSHLNGFGYVCADVSDPTDSWSVAAADLEPVALSPLTRLITAAAGIAVAFLEGRVSIEQRWHDTDRTTYRIVIKEKA